jgi:hypothetical protein
MQFTLPEVEAVVAETGIPLCTSIEKLREDLNLALVGRTIISAQPFAPKAHKKKADRLRSLANGLARELALQGLDDPEQLRSRSRRTCRQSILALTARKNVRS